MTKPDIFADPDGHEKWFVQRVFARIRIIERLRVLDEIQKMLADTKDFLTPRTYKIGYGKPPVHTRWKKGQSGNPSGRH